MTPSYYFSRLDHLRFYAASLLVFHHFRVDIIARPEAIDSLSSVAHLWIYGGSTGVSLFLVLSGFLFCIITDAGKRKINYFGFIKNRILRVFPLLILLFSIVITISRSTSTPMDILRLLTLQLNTGHPMTGWGHEYFPVGPIWTIAVEFQFYLLFPFLVVILNTCGVKNMFGLVFLMILVKLLITAFSGIEMYYNLYQTITGRLDQFIIGMILGYYYINRTFSFMEEKKIYSILLLVVAFFLLSLFIYKFKIGYFYNTLGFTIEAILWSCVLLGYITMPIKMPVFLDQLLSQLGALSYSIYLLHLPVGIVLIRSLASFDITFPSSVGHIVIVPVILFSFVTYTFLEKPFLLMKSKYLQPN